MRWFVEISTLGRNSVQSPTLCVEAPQWQPALQKARALRGDDAALGNFSIELLDDGYRAIDAASRLRYVVRRAPDDAELTTEGSAAASKTGSSDGKSLVDCRILSTREDNPSEHSPLTYRECVYAVAEGTPESEARALILDRFQALRETLSATPTGKLINLAVFDHAFEGRPRRRPVVTLTWKDWKGSEPELRYPLREGSVAPPPPSGSDAGPPAPAAAAPPTGTAATASAAPKSADAPKSASTPKSAGKAPTTKPLVTKASGKAPKRLSGDELISELFEAFSDLHFLRDALEGADFVLALTLEKLPSEVGLISLFDINKREFVVVRQTGGPKSILLAKLPEKAGLAHAAMRTQRAIVVRSATSDARVGVDDRWSKMGILPKSVLCAPVQVSGRYLGLIELANAVDGQPYTDGDGHALSYIGEQFAEFVATQGVVIDPDAILAPQKK